MSTLGLLPHLANHPDIKGWVAPGHETVDVSDFNKPGVELLGDRDGAVLFRPISHGVYEMHYLFTRAVRGKAALDRIRKAVEVIFTDREATAICGAVPREHRASRVMSRALGARPFGSHTDYFGRACIVYVIERASWDLSSVALSEASAR